MYISPRGYPFQYYTATLRKVFSIFYFIFDEDFPCVIVPRNFLRGVSKDTSPKDILSKTKQVFAQLEKEHENQCCNTGQLPAFYSLTY